MRSISRSQRLRFDSSSLWGEYSLLVSTLISGNIAVFSSLPAMVRCSPASTAFRCHRHLCPLVDLCSKSHHSSDSFNRSVCLARLPARPSSRPFKDDTRRGPCMAGVDRGVVCGCFEYPREAFSEEFKRTGSRESPLSEHRRALEESYSRHVAWQA